MDEMGNQEVGGTHGGVEDINITNTPCESLRVPQRRKRDELCYDEGAKKALEIRDENRLCRYWSIIRSTKLTVGRDANQ